MLSDWLLQLFYTLLHVFLPLTMSNDEFSYSEKYADSHYEYRHVHVPTTVVHMIPKNRLLTETEWRNLGVQQSPGWEHYMIHGPERHILLFRRPLSNPTVSSRSAANKKSGVCR